MQVCISCFLFWILSVFFSLLALLFFDDFSEKQQKANNNRAMNKANPIIRKGCYA